MISSTALAGLANWPDSPLGTPLDIDGSKTGTKSTLVTFVKYLYEWGIALGGLAAFIALIISGFLYLTSTGDPAKMNEAKNRATWAIGGLVLLLSSWLILYTINPELTILRKLPENFEEDLGSAMSCQTNDDCKKWGNDYICNEGVCLLPWEDLLSQKPCAKISIITESATGTFPGSPSNPIEIKMRDFFYYRPSKELETLLEPGERFWYWTEPEENCWGLLYLAEGTLLGFRCSKDGQHFTTKGHSEANPGYGQSRGSVFCMEYIEVPGWDVPKFAHRPRGEPTEKEKELDKITPPEDAPYVDCPTIAYPDACKMTFTDAKGTTHKADDWCHGLALRWSDSHTYRFCVGNTYYSFGCAFSGWKMDFRCDSKSALKRECTDTCIPWTCERAYGCKSDGDCVCTPLTCGDIGGTCRTAEECNLFGMICNSYSSYECGECCCRHF